jgi:hypothetical protein
MTIISAQLNGKPSSKFMALEKITIKISKVNVGGQLPHHFFIAFARSHHIGQRQPLASQLILRPQTFLLNPQIFFLMDLGKFFLPV